MSVHILDTGINIDYTQYIQRTVLLDDPNYSVYYRYDFKDNVLTKNIETILAAHGIPYQCNNRIFFTAYKPGGFINLHQDGHSNGSTHTVLVYLNDNYEDGELVMPGLGLRIHPKAGSILIMDQDIYHRVEPITKGNKYVLRLDAMKMTQ